MQGLIKTEKAEISVLDLTKAEFNEIKWLDANEFIFDNVLYDLVSLNKTSSGFNLKVVSDKKETNVLEKMKEEHSKKCLGELFQIISQYSNDVTSLSFSRIPDQVKFNLEAPIHYLSLITEQDSPPPKLMF
jgi:hypothetical protein